MCCFVYFTITSFSVVKNCIGGVMVSMLTSGVVDHGSGQTKNYQIGICCFLAKYVNLTPEVSMLTITPPMQFLTTEKLVIVK
jgi:hypothetical protein